MFVTSAAVSEAVQIATRRCGKIPPHSSKQAHRPLYLPDRIPVPWRLLKAWERFALVRPFARPWSYPTRAGTSTVAKVLALGDLSLTGARTADADAFSELRPLLGSVDLRVGNLEAAVTTQTAPAALIGSCIRS